MASLFDLAWQHAIDWPGKNFILPDASATWARWRLQYVLANQSSLSDVGGKRRWQRQGMVMVQVFTPLNTGTELLYSAAEIVVGAYEGKRTPGGVWFRNVRISGDSVSDVASEVTNWSQLNVLADFQFDQIH